MFRSLIFGLWQAAANSDNSAGLKTKYLTTELLSDNLSAAPKLPQSVALGSQIEGVDPECQSHYC
jgi:hypothetical protein